MELFRIDNVSHTNNLTILQGLRHNNTRFFVYISRHSSMENIIVPSYIFSNGTYYIVSIMNEIDNHPHNNLNNFLWQNVNYNNNNFPFYTYGLSEIVYFYIKGLIT